MPDKNTNRKIAELIADASQKLGIPAGELLSALSNPEMADATLSKIREKSGGKFGSLDESSLKRRVMENPDAKKLFDEIVKGHKNGR